MPTPRDLPVGEDGHQRVPLVDRFSRNAECQVGVTAGATECHVGNESLGVRPYKRGGECLSSQLLRNIGSCDVVVEMVLEMPQIIGFCVSYVRRIGRPVFCMECTFIHLSIQDAVAIDKRQLIGSGSTHDIAVRGRPVDTFSAGGDVVCGKVEIRFRAGRVCQDLVVYLRGRIHLRNKGRAKILSVDASIIVDIQFEPFRWSIFPTIFKCIEAESEPDGYTDKSVGLVAYESGPEDVRTAGRPYFDIAEVSEEVFPLSSGNARGRDVYFLAGIDSNPSLRVFCRLPGGVGQFK